MALLFRLETTDGVPADLPTLTSAVPNWSSGDTIPLGAGRTLRVRAKEQARTRPTNHEPLAASPVVCTARGC